MHLKRLITLTVGIYFMYVIFSGVNSFGWRLTFFSMDENWVFEDYIMQKQVRDF